MRLATNPPLAILWPLQGLERERHAINQGALDGHVARMGGGDFEAGTSIKAAIDLWQQELTALGAGPLEKLENINRKKGADGATGLTLQLLRELVEEGWPGSAAAFTKALAAGPELMQLATRWVKSQKTWRASRQPTQEVQDKLALRRSLKRSRGI